MKKRLLALLVAAAMAVLTGCISSEVEMDFQPDGSGTLTMSSYMIDEFYTSMETTPEEVFAEELAKGATLVTKEIEGVPYTGATLTTPFAHVSELGPTGQEDPDEPITLWATTQLLNGEQLVTIHSRVPADSEITGGLVPTESEAPVESAPADTELPPETAPSGTETTPDSQTLPDSMMTMEMRITFPAGVKSVTGLDETVYTIQDNTISVDMVSSSEATQFTITGSLGKVETLPDLEHLKATAAYDGRFTDVPDGRWYTAAVIYNFEHGIINGMTPTTFVPDGQLTLAQVLKMASVVHATYQGSTDAGLFAPIQGQAWYQPYLDYALVNALAEPELTNAPDRPATRAEMAAVISRCLPASALTGTLAPVDFTDVDEATPYADSIALLQAAGIVGGITQDSFGPDQPLTRAQAAVFFHRLTSPADRLDG